MILKRIKGNSPYTLIMVFILAFVLRYPMDHSQVPVATPFAAAIMLFFNPYPVVLLGIAGVLIGIQAFFINRLNYKYIFIESQTYLPSLFYVLFTGSLWFASGFHPVMIGNLFLLLAFDRFFVMTKENNLFSNYYEGMFLLVVGSLFYGLMIYMVPLFFIILLIMRPFNWREWAVALLGIVTPLFIVLTFYLIFNFPFNYLGFLTAIYSEQHFIISSSPVYYAFLVFFLILLLSMGYMFSELNRRKISARKYFNVFFYSLLAIAAVYWLIPGRAYELMYIVAIPASYLLGNYFNQIRSRFWSEFLFTLLIISFIAVRYWDIATTLI